jgi:hypothetical protein
VGSQSADTIKLIFRFRCGPKRRQEATGAQPDDER